MKRRALALFLAVCLVAGFAALPTGAAAAPTLVCRITGQPMAPVMVADETAAAPDTERSCCAITPKMGANGSTRYALVAPGCCDLRAIPERDEAPAAIVAAPETAFVAWVPAPPVLLVPPTTEAVTPPSARSEAAPRAPPRSSASPRAPPFFS
jgi:hypothetical protein